MIEEKNINKETKAYISGKTEDVNIIHVEKKFEVAENFLISIGMVPINPIKNGLSEKSSKKKNLLKDIELLLNSNTIFVLDNWIDSTQSRIEMKIAKEFGIPIIFESNVYRNISKIEKMKAAITEVMGLSFEQYTTKSRDQNLFYARMIMINHCRQQEEMSLKDIGQLINRDHTTVMHGIKTFKNEIKFNVKFRKTVEKINTILT